ncbi:MAG: SUMF1/EgtB/PvdO family nonheme iron enzyme [Nitrospinae bacterium]|nr:SUMF1/EgtB/PvdO family nonheme iron enzyme [Nitrospinota bacterium]
MKISAKQAAAVTFTVLFLAFHHTAHSSNGGVKPAPEGMALVPAGDFLMGSTQQEIDSMKKEFGGRVLYKDYPFETEMPKRKVKLKAFYIDIYEVTNRKYMEFIKQTGHAAPQHWSGGTYPADSPDNPVLYVNKEDAEAYAKWAHKRLPTEEEWEKAARGTDGRVFPWGNKFDPNMAATADSNLEFIEHGFCKVNTGNKVGLAPGDVSPYGAHDMAGNSREWTATLDPAHKDMAVLKGASWVDLNITARAAYRESVPVESRSHIITFRCVKDAE